MRKLISRLLPRSRKAESTQTDSSTTASGKKQSAETNPQSDHADSGEAESGRARRRDNKSGEGRSRNRSRKRSGKGRSNGSNNRSDGRSNDRPNDRQSDRSGNRPSRPKRSRSRSKAPDTAEPVVIPRDEHGIDANRVSRNARQVVEGLRDAGYSAELVGGCVRDLLLGLRPKDFDVATDATPEEVREIFRRARLVGRRFRLAHVRMGRDILEVATYRAAPGKNENDTDHAMTDDGRLISDNVYGTRGQDAVRRDFTVNALYYDPLSEEVLDYVGGYDDVIERRLTMIGEAEPRLREDPVRILRAVRFASRLELDVEESCAEAIPRLAHLLADTPPARLFDEMLKLFHYGHAADTYESLAEHGVFEHMFPETAEMIADGDSVAEQLLQRSFANTDTRVNEGKPVIAPFLFAAILWRPMSERYEANLEAGEDPRAAMYNAAEDTIAVQNERSFQPRLESQSKKRIARFVEHKRFRAAYDFLLLRAAVGEVTQELADWWTSYAEAKPSSSARQNRGDGDSDGDGEAGARGSGRPRRRRKRGGRRRRKPQSTS